MFSPPNAAFGHFPAYQGITLALFGLFPLDAKEDLHMEFGRCANKSCTKLASCGTGRLHPCREVDWAPPQLVDGIYQERCMCNSKDPNMSSSLPKCQDEPDDPRANQWCSLCAAPSSTSRSRCSPTMLPR